MLALRLAVDAGTGRGVSNSGRLLGRKEEEKMLKWKSLLGKEILVS